MFTYYKHGKHRTGFTEFEKWLCGFSAWSNSTKTFRSFSLKTVVRGWGEFGKLPQDWKRTLATRIDCGAVDYLIYSYQTPIAWFDKEANIWIVPGVTYSPTTSQHQSAVRAGLPYYRED